MKRVIDDPAELGNLSAADMDILRDVHAVMKEASQLAQDTLFDKEQPQVRRVCSACERLVAVPKPLHSADHPARAHSLPTPYAHTLQRFPEFMSTFKVRLRGLAEGECVAFPTGWMGSGGHAIFFILEREAADDSYALVVCNTGLGIGYHPQDISYYPKTKCRTCVRLQGIPGSRLVEDGWLYCVFQLMGTRKIINNVDSM